MKTGHPIHVDRRRAKDPPGGEWSELDPVVCGQVQVLPAGTTPVTQAQAVVAELRRLSGLPSTWEWSSCAVVARQWSYLDPVRSLCELEGIPVQMGNEEFTGLRRLRETQAMLGWLRERESTLVASEDLRCWLLGQPPGPWIDLLREGIDEFALETGGSETSVEHFVEWLGRVGTGGAPSTAWRPAHDGPPRQGAGVRPRGRAGRRLGPGRSWRGRRRPPQAVLRGDDPRSTYSDACPTPRAASATGCTAGNLISTDGAEEPSRHPGKRLPSSRAGTGASACATSS